MLEHWNPRCPPGWSPERMALKVHNAYHYGFDQPGISAPEVMFSKIETPKAERPRLWFEMFDDVEPEVGRPALVDGLLDHGAMTVLYGQSNEGKTFVSLDIGFAIARGVPWLGKDTEQGGVIYIAAEGGGNIKKRFKALRLHYQAQRVPMALIPCPVDLGGTGADVQPLLDLIAAAWEKTGKVVFLVIDTLSRAMAGGNENAPDDMTAFVRNVDRLRVATGCHVLVVHHSGKDQAKGARGHSSLRAATDTEIEVADKTITATKQRDMSVCAPVCFELLPVEIGHDTKGRAVTSCVVMASNRVAADEFALKPLKGWAAKAFAVLQDMTEAGLNPAGKVHRDEWKAEIVRLYLGDKEPKTASDTARRAIHAVLEANRAILETDFVSPA